MNPFAQTKAQKIMAGVLTLNHQMRDLIALEAQYKKEWETNDVLSEFLADEAAVDVESGEVAIFGDYDTNDLRRSDAAWNAFRDFQDDALVVTLANGDTETTTFGDVMRKYFVPYQG